MLIIYQSILHILLHVFMFYHLSISWNLQLTPLPLTLPQSLLPSSCLNSYIHSYVLLQPLNHFKTCHLPRIPAMDSHQHSNKLFPNVAYKAGMVWPVYLPQTVPITWNTLCFSLYLVNFQHHILIEAWPLTGHSHNLYIRTYMRFGVIWSVLLLSLLFSC